MSNREFFRSLVETPHVVQESAPFTKRNHSDVLDLQWNSTGTKIAFSKLDKSIHILHRSYEIIENSQQITNAHEKPVEKIAFHPVREYEFCSVADDDTVKIWQTNHIATTYKSVKTIHNSAQTKNFLCQYSPCGAYLAIVDKSNHITIYTTSSYEPLITYTESQNVYDFTWSNTSGIFLVGLDSGLVTINCFGHSVQRATGTIVYSIYRAHSIDNGVKTSIVKQVKYDPRGQYFVTATQQGLVQIFSTESLCCTRTIATVDEAVSCVDISRDGANLVVCFEVSNPARVYDAFSGEEVAVIEDCREGKRASCLAKFSPGKTTLVYTSYKDGGVVFLSKPQEKRQQQQVHQRSRI